MSRDRLIVFVLAAGLLSSTVAGAEAPKIDRIFPPGLQRGTSVDVKLSGKPGDGHLKAWTDQGQLAFEFTEKNDAVKVTAPEDARPGIHWLRFYNEHGATDLRPFFVGVIPELAEAEPNNDAATAQGLDAVPVTVNGVLQKADDVDTFGVLLKAGTTFIASMQANRDLGSPMDSVLQLLGPDGSVIAHNDDDHGFDPQIVFEVPNDGRYFVRTFAFPSTPNSTIRLAGSADYIYRLTMTSEAFVDYTVPAVVNSGAPGSVVVHGWNLAVDQVSVELPEFEGKLFPVTGSFANTAFVNATDWPSLAEAEGEQQLLGIPSAVTGCISEPGQSDIYVIDGNKGQKLTLEVESRSMHSQLDPVLKIVDADGKELKEADDRSREDLDAEVSVTLKSDGRHTVSIKDRYSHGGLRFFYVLKCSETKPDFSTSLKANAFAFADDKPLEIPVDIVRTNGMAEVIIVKADGLPEGVTAEAVESAKDSDTAKKVTLKVVRSETAAAYTGPFRILANARDSDAQHAAEAVISKLTVKTEHLWLTVPAPPEKPQPEEEAETKGDADTETDAKDKPRDE